MKNILSESTKVASYLLWEKTKHNNALDLWYCSENIAFYLENNDITTMVLMENLLNKSKYDYSYINFIRNISFRIFLSTDNKDHLLNWFVAETLLEDKEWCRAIINMAYVFRVMRDGKIDASVRTEWIRRNLEGGHNQKFAPHKI